MTTQLFAILLFTLLAALEGWRGSFVKKHGEVPADKRVELLGTAIVLLVTQPAVMLSAYALMGALAPQQQDALANWPLWAQVALLLLFDDMMQYWWHRASHSIPWLYGLHRAHHNAEYLSVRVVYRNNVFYYLLMPSIWLSGVMIYLGLGAVFAVYLMVKIAVIFGAHCEVRWDERLYQIRWLAPLMWLVERTISTPSTHAAHHGKHRDDGVTHYKGNFGNLLFFWDVLFGTARITRRYPEQFGVENLPKAGWRQQLFWPLARGSSATVEAP